MLEKLGFEEIKHSSSMNDLVDTLDPVSARSRENIITVTAPYWRSDINIEEDVIEE